MDVCINIFPYSFEQKLIDLGMPVAEAQVLFTAADWTGESPQGPANKRLDWVWKGKLTTFYNMSHGLGWLKYTCWTFHKCLCNIDSPFGMIAIPSPTWINWSDVFDALTKDVGQSQELNVVSSFLGPAWWKESIWPKKKFIHQPLGCKISLKYGPAWKLWHCSKLARFARCVWGFVGPCRLWRMCFICRLSPARSFTIFARDIGSIFLAPKIKQDQHQTSIFIQSYLEPLQKKRNLKKCISHHSSCFKITSQTIKRHGFFGLHNLWLQGEPWGLQRDPLFGCRYVKALNASTGTILWSYQPDTPVWNFLPLFPDETSLLFQDWQWKLAPVNPLRICWFWLLL